MDDPRASSLPGSSFVPTLIIQLMYLLIRLCFVSIELSSYSVNYIPGFVALKALYRFPWAAVTNYHRLGLKRQKSSFS